MPYSPLLKHVNALGRPKRDVTFGVARLVGTRLRPPPLITPGRDLVTARRSTDNACLRVIFGVLQHVRKCTPRFYISRTAEPIALIFGM